MKTYLRQIMAFIINDEEGAAALEYAILLMLIALVVIVGATTFGSKVGDMFTTSAGKVP